MKPGKLLLVFLWRSDAVVQNAHTVLYLQTLKFQLEYGYLYFVLVTSQNNSVVKIKMKHDPDPKT